MQVDFHQDWYRLKDQLHQEKQILEKLDEQVKLAKEEIETVDAVITDECGDLLGHIENLKRHINVVRTEIQIENGETTREEVDKKTYVKPQPLQVSKDVEDKCTKLYRKISRICHPDKTDNTVLHALMTQANVAREFNDYKRLQAIYLEALHPSVFKKSESIFPTITQIEQQMLSQLEEFKTRIDSLQRQLQSFKNDEGILTIYRDNPEQAIDIIRQQLELQENGLELDLARLKHQLKQVQLAKKYPNFNYSITMS